MPEPTPPPRVWTGDVTPDRQARERSVARTEDNIPDLPHYHDVTRPTHRHHQGQSPTYAGLHTGRRRNPKAGELVIHRPGEPDEVISVTAFRRRARDGEQPDADAGQDPQEP